MASHYIKTNRVFTPVRKYAWLFVPIVAVGGLWYPKLGLLIIPLMLTLMVMGFLRGKYWCGNICPHGSLFDYVILPISMNKKIPSFMKSKITMAIFFTWFMYMITSRTIKAFEVFGTASFWDRLGYVFIFNYLIVTIVGTILAVFVNSRSWCSFCPMGTMELLLYKLGKVLGLNKKTDLKITASNPDKCIACGKCSKVCPVQLEPYKNFSDNNQFQNTACIKCSTCVVNCPVKVLSLQKEGQDSVSSQEKVAKSA